MPKLRSFKEFIKTFWWLTVSDWREMDRKILRIAASVISFVFWALFWLYFFRSSTPFG